jgi:23S rRNA pseudouridine2457 synthase
MLIAFNKPYSVVSQFTPDGSPNRTLAAFGFPKNVYPIGRLDADSEGLLLLSDEPEWNERLLHPRHAHEREYWAQVEKIPAPEILQKLERGVSIQGRKTLPCHAWILEPQPEVIPAPAARPAHPFPQERARLLDWAGTRRRQKPAGAPHDRRHRPSYPAVDSRTHWKFLARYCARRSMADADNGGM